jgi:hypothetical protein
VEQLCARGDAATPCREEAGPKAGTSPTGPSRPQVPHCPGLTVESWPVSDAPSPLPANAQNIWATSTFPGMCDTRSGLSFSDTHWPFFGNPIHGESLLLESLPPCCPLLAADRSILASIKGHPRMSSQEQVLLLTAQALPITPLLLTVTLRAPGHLAAQPPGSGPAVQVSIFSSLNLLSCSALQHGAPQLHPGGTSPLPSPGHSTHFLPCLCLHHSLLILAFPTWPVLTLGCPIVQCGIRIHSCLVVQANQDVGMLTNVDPH